MSARDFFARFGWNGGKIPRRGGRGHGGMDGLVLSAFAESVKNGWDSPIDVYDAASAMCISALSEESIATGMAVGIPDFTNGMWLCRKEKTKSPLYSL